MSRTGTPSIGQELLQIYERLYSTFGPQHWWPAEEPFEVIVGAILTQSAAWTNVRRAIANLKAANALNPDGLRASTTSELANLVFPAGYYNMKARKLKAFVSHLDSRFEADLGRLFALEKGALRQELLSIYGIGPETADSIILYAAGKPVFVVDAYTRRLFSRLGVTSADATYDSMQSVFESNLPGEVGLFNEYHALIVAQCKVNCRSKPLCAGCCLNAMCRVQAMG